MVRIEFEVESYFSFLLHYVEVWGQFLILAVAVAKILHSLLCFKKWDCSSVLQVDSFSLLKK